MVTVPVTVPLTAPTTIAPPTTVKPRPVYPVVTIPAGELVEVAPGSAGRGVPPPWPRLQTVVAPCPAWP